MVVGNHDGRNGGRARTRPRAVPPHARHQADSRATARYPYDSFPSVEVLEEGAKAFGWDKRNPAPRWHAGTVQARVRRRHVAAPCAEPSATTTARRPSRDVAAQSGQGGGVFSTELELTADGFVTMKVALPDSGSNAVTAHAHLVAEMLGFTTRDRVRLVWGDTDIAPTQQFMGRGPHDHAAGSGHVQRRGQAQKGPASTRREPLEGGRHRASDPRRRDFIDRESEETHDLRGAGQGQQRQHPPDRTRRAEQRTSASNKGVGACFVEVEVDTWTGDWRFIRALYPHDTGLVVNPLTAEADMVGSLVESTQVATDPIPWDREFPGTRHYSVGYLSYRLPTIMDVPKLDAAVHRQPRAPMVLRHQGVQRDEHRRRAGRDRECHLQRLRGQDQRASDHTGKDHGGAERPAASVTVIVQSFGGVG